MLCILILLLIIIFEKTDKKTKNLVLPYKQLTVKPHFSGHSFIGIFTYRDLATSFIGTFCFSSSYHSLYIVTWSGVRWKRGGTPTMRLKPLEIPRNEVFTFQGRPNKWGFTVYFLHVFSLIINSMKLAGTEESPHLWSKHSGSLSR